MSKSTNLMIVVIVTAVVMAACILNIAGLWGGLNSGTTPEWRDYFRWNDRSYINTYNTINKGYVGKNLGEINKSVNRAADASTYVPENGEAVYLSIGTKLYSVRGYDPDSYIAVDDGGDYYLYTIPDAPTDEILAKCGVRSDRESVDFVCTSLPTVHTENSDYGVRISVIETASAMRNYLSRYVNDFERDDGTYTWQSTVDDREYGDGFFGDNIVIALLLPEDDGKVTYNVSTILSDKAKMTILLRRYVLPYGTTYDTCTVRHLLLEVSKKDYHGQKIAYQIDQRILDNTEIAEGTKSSDVMFSTVKFIDSASDVTGTKYASILPPYMTREYFETNLAIVVGCWDEGQTDRYSIGEIEFSAGNLYINIDRHMIGDGEKDPRISYFVLTFPKSEYCDEIIIPAVHHTEEPPEEMPYTPRDIAVCDDIDSVTRLAKTYDIPEGMYDDDFFDNYVLLFVGGVEDSSVGYRYGDCRTDDGRIVITVEETLPEECTDEPIYKYISIPYLRSAYHGETLSAELVTVREWEEKDDLNGQP